MRDVGGDVQRITLNASCLTISCGRTEQLVIMQVFCRVTSGLYEWFSQCHSCGSRVEHTRFFHGALQLWTIMQPLASRYRCRLAYAPGGLSHTYIYISRVSAMPNHGPVPRTPRSFYAHNVWPTATIFNKVARAKDGHVSRGSNVPTKRTQRLPNTLIPTVLFRRMLNVSIGLTWKIVFSGIFC